MASISLDKVRNIGISAHIDSGKTTLSERILSTRARSTQRIEEVRGKSGVGAKMDSMDLEREKGITIQSAATYCEWDGYDINLIDTPGHVDFTIEVERALRVLDGAVLVLCGTSGVQSQSYTVDRQMRRYNVPRLAFINKLDRAGADPARVTHQLKEKLRHNTITIQLPIGAEADFEGIIDLIKQKAFYFDGDNGEDIREEEIPADRLEEVKTARHDMIASIADHDDAIADKFLAEQEPSVEEIHAAIRRVTIALKMTPVFIGSAYKNKGVQLMLDGVNMYLPNPKEVTNIALDQDKKEEKVILESDPEEAVRRPGVQARGRALRPAHLHAHLPGDADQGRLHRQQLEQPQARQGAASRAHALERDERHRDHDGGRHRRAVRRRVLVGRHVHRRIDQLHDDLDARARGRHLAGRVAPRTRPTPTQFSKALNRFTKEDPTFRVHRDEESAQTIIRGHGRAAPRDLHRAHEARVRL